MQAKIQLQHKQILNSSQKKDLNKIGTNQGDQKKTFLILIHTLCYGLHIDCYITQYWRTAIRISFTLGKKQKQVLIPTW